MSAIESLEMDHREGFSCSLEKQALLELHKRVKALEAAGGDTYTESMLRGKIAELNKKLEASEDMVAELKEQCESRTR